MYKRKEQKDNVLFRRTWIEAIHDEDATQEENDQMLGAVLRAVMDYQFSGVLPNRKDPAYPYVKMIKPYVDEDVRRYKSACERNAANRRGKSNIQDDESSPVVTNGTDMDIHMDMDKQKVIDKDIVVTTTAAAEEQLKADVMAAWNSMASQNCVRAIKSISERRAQALRTVLSHVGKDDLIHMIRDIPEQHYLAEWTKTNGPLDFDWFMKEDNFLRIIEGSYKEPYNRPGKHKGGGMQPQDEAVTRAILCGLEVK